MKSSPFKKIVIIIIIALLVPIFLYTILQFIESDKNEKFIETIYDRQLSSILFSVNQHCWDIFTSWESEMTTLAESFTRHSYSRLKSGLYNFHQSQASVSGSFVRFNKQIIIYSLENENELLNDESSRSEFINKINTIVNENNSALERIVSQAQKGYVRPIAFSWDEHSYNRITLLVFPIIENSYTGESTILAGIFVHDLDYIQEIVARKFGSMNDGNFVFAVQQNDEIIFTTDESEEEKYEKKEALWILPDLDIQIKLKGTTLAQLSKTRVRNNLILLSIVNLVFLCGVGYLIYNVYTEISLARMKTSFVANVSHELRTPLALIRMFAETLEMGRVNSEEKKQHYYKTIMSESARLSQLINNILDFSKIESHKKEYHFEWGSLVLLLTQTLDIYHFRFVQTGFEVDVDIDDKLPDIQLDSEAVTQAIVNLLDNAVKYSVDEKYIKVSLTRNNGYLELAVEDKGIGIHESEHEKIFEKFYRAGSSLVHNTKGSGLGLSLVKHIMDVHQGKITVRSKLNKGSTFTLAFPLHIKNGVH